MALIFAGIYKSLQPVIGEHAFLGFLGIMIQINLVLMVLNLLPLPPLDGSKVFLSLIPLKNYHETLIKFESMFMFSILILILFGSYLIFPPVKFLMGFMGIPL
jgi:Zn-dependent protease